MPFAMNSFPLLRRLASSPGSNWRSAGRVAMHVNKAARGASAEGSSERTAESAPTASAAIPASDVSADTVVATAAATNHPRGVDRSGRNRLRLSSVCGFGFNLPRSVEFCARWRYRGTGSPQTIYGRAWRDLDRCRASSLRTFSRRSGECFKLMGR
jgi:hypothetical protein